MIYCGIDWAERTHDVALVNDTGTLVAKRHITDDAAGYKLLLELLDEHGDTKENPIPVAIETSRGLLVAVLRTGKRKVYAINPMAAARYRDRHSVSRKKSDPGDALVLANILRTDMHAHRPLPGDSDLGRAIAVLAHAQQDACGTGSRSPTSSVPCCSSTTRLPWTPSPPGPMACAALRPANSSRQL
ncbi:transposase [Streptomyces canus]|nr:transposase [Streptomyces canus]